MLRPLVAASGGARICPKRAFSSNLKSHQRTAHFEMAADLPRNGHLILLTRIGLKKKFSFSTGYYFKIEINNNRLPAFSISK